MDEIVAALADQHAELEGIVAGLDDAGWAHSTRCEGWTVADVVLHLAVTDDLAIGSLEGDLDSAFEDFTAGLPGPPDVEGWAGAAVQRDRGASPVEILGRWRNGSRRVRELAAGLDPAERLDWLVGDMAARSLATTRLAECWIHTEDVGLPLGHDVAPTDRLWHIARLTWRTVPYAFDRADQARPGAVSFDLDAPTGGRWTFGLDGADAGHAVNHVTGSAVDLCRVAGQRLSVADSDLVGDGPEADQILALLRTFA